jgi:hypothetical protein
MGDPTYEINCSEALTSRPNSLIHFLQSFNQVNILPFVKTTNIVRVVVYALMKNQINSYRMIFQKKPITSVFAVSIDH